MKASLSSGTHYTVDSANLSPKDICAIVKECKNSGVTQFSYKDLKISFTQKIDVVEDYAVAGGPTPSASEVPRGTVDTGEFKEDLLGELLLSNPTEYERLIEKEAYLDGEDDKRSKSVLRRGEEL